MKLEFSIQIFEKFTNVKCYENPFSRSRVAACGQTDMTKLIVALRNFVKAPKKIMPMETKHVVQQRHFAQPTALDLHLLPI